jgi:ATP synthase protein I
MSWSVVSTMLGYPLGGIIVGFAIDQIAGTTPWVTIGLMFTAFVGGCLQAVRINQNQNKK